MVGARTGSARGVDSAADPFATALGPRPALPRRFATDVGPDLTLPPVLTAGPESSPQGPPDQLRPSPDLWRFIVIAVLGIVIGLVILFWDTRIDDPLLALLTAANLILCGIGVARALGDGRTRPLNLMFFVFFLAWIAIASTYQLSHHLASRDDNALTYNLPITTAAQLMTCLALSSFLLGGWWADRFERRPPPPAPQQGPAAAVVVSESDVRRGKFRLFLELVFVAALLPLAIKSAGGIGGLFSSRDALATAHDTVGLNESGGASTGLFAILPGSLALAVAYSYLARRQRIREACKASGEPFRANRMRDAGALMAVAIGLSLLYNNPFVRTRYIALTAIAALILIRFPLRTARAGAIAVIVILVGLFTLYPLANQFRGNKYIDAQTNVGLDQLAGPDFDGFQQVANTIIYVRQHGHTNGADTASAALFFVPRSVWATKARPGGILVAANRNYSFTDLSLPIHAEVYLDFGYVGMIIFMAAWGYGWRRFDGLYLKRSTAGLCVLVPYLAVAQLGFIRGPLNSLAPVYLPTLLILILNLRSKKSA